jgi:hypothetical protein
MTTFPPNLYPVVLLSLSNFTVHMIMTKYPVQVTATVTCKTDPIEEILFVMQYKIRRAI